MSLVATLKSMQGRVLSSTAQLVAQLEFEGVTDTKEMAALTGKSLRMIQVARKELRGNETGCAKQVASGETGCAERNILRETGCVSPRVHTRIETPSGLLIPSEVAASSVQPEASEPEIEGLNGSTPKLVGQLAKWLAGDLGFPNREAARAVIAGNVDAYGAPKVRAGMLELETLIASGTKPRDLGKAFSAYIKNAKLPKADEPEKPLVPANVLRFAKPAAGSAWMDEVNHG